MVADWLSRLEQRLAEGDEDDLAVALVVLAYAAGDAVGVPDDERRPAARRALLLLAAGGDPARGLDLDGRAVAALAADLETERRLKTLLSGLADLRLKAKGRQHVTEAIRELMAEPDVAWRAYAAGILAEELEG